MPLPASFPVARYRLVCTAEQPLRLPEYAGSMLRGAFGHALRRLACVTRESDCAACALYRRCPYPAIFESPPPLDYARRTLSHVPHPFVIEPPPWGEHLVEAGAAFDFGLVLIGPALQQLPLLVAAWHKALQQGLGPQQARVRLDQVVADADAAPVPAVAGSMAQPQPQPQPQPLSLPPAAAAPPAVTLVFDTPLRLQSNGRALTLAELTPHELLMALLRRTAQIVELQLGGTLDVDFSALKAQARSISGEATLAWRDWTRHSSRQQQHMVLGGAVGRWTLRGDLTPFWPLLHLGQWLHVGKNATFGLGRYRLENAA